MRDFRSRVIQVRFTSELEGDCLRKADQTRYCVVILYPLGVKRQLATLEAATTRAAVTWRRTWTR